MFLVVLPLVVFFSIAKHPPSTIIGFSNALVIGFLVSSICFILAVAISTRSHDSRETAVAFSLNSGYMNVTYLGFPAVYAVFGSAALGPATLYAMGVGVPNLLLGTALLTLLSNRRISGRSLALSVISFPAVFALIAALLFVAFSAPIPSLLYEPFDHFVAPVFFALMLLLAGFQITLVSPRKYWEELISVGVIRFLLSPAIAYALILALGLSFTTDMSPKPALLQSAMPPAIFNLILAHNFKQNTKLYGALVFYLTLVFLFGVLPVISLLLG